MKECFWCGEPISEDYKFGRNTVFHDFCCFECEQAWEKEELAKKKEEVECKKQEVVE